MSSLFPFRSDVEHAPADATVVGLTDEVADEVFATLSSATARTILGALYEAPQTPGDLREVTDTSLQNVHYHLTNMENAGLIEVVGTWYSETGNEMNVYGPSSRALLVMASDHEDRSLLRGLLARVFVVAVLVGLSVWAFASTVADTAVPRMEAASSVATDSAPAGASAMAPEVAFALGAGVALIAVGLVVAAGVVRRRVRRDRAPSRSE